MVLTDNSLHNFDVFIKESLNKNFPKDGWYRGGFVSEVKGECHLRLIKQDVKDASNPGSEIRREVQVPVTNEKEMRKFIKNEVDKFF